MAGFGRVNEEGGRAGRGEACCDLLADMAGLADAGDNHVPVSRQDQFDGREQRVAKRGFKLFQRVPLNAYDAAGEGKVRTCAHGSEAPGPVQDGERRFAGAGRLRQVPG